MATLFPRKNNDWNVRNVAPKNDQDYRVPMAEEFALNGEISTSVVLASRKDEGWVKRPVFTVTQPRTLVITSAVVRAAALSNYEAEVAGTITVPALPSTGSLVKQEDWVSLVAFSAEVGAAQDPTLGQVSFNYREETNAGEIVIKSATKENSRRIRSFWVWVISPNSLTKADFYAALPLNSAGQPTLTISDKSAAGFSLGTIRAFAGDDTNLALNAAYPVFEDLISIVPAFKIRRWQNFDSTGYTWGANGESPLSEAMILLAGKDLLASGIPERIDRRIYEILAGLPGANAGWSKAVLNLLAGSVASNTGNAGIPAASPNGSFCLANDQRVSYLNQAIVSTLACTTIENASNDGNGNALLTFALNTNAPSGTYFSSDRNHHRIFNANGTDITALGRFQNLGQGGSLIWVSEGSSSGISPGEKAIFQPGIVFPAGSGFSIPFDSCDKAWLGSIPLDNANIRYGHLNNNQIGEDIDEYEDPTNGEFFVVFSKERAGILYIYKRISVVANGSGILTVPALEKGVFAFVQGVAGRVDAPIVSGIPAGTTRKALIYYPPRSTENWQFRFNFCEYQKSAVLPAQLDGAEIISIPRTFIHTQGGGNSAYFGESRLKYTPISMHLPESGFAIPTYSINTPVALSGESLPTPVAFREIDYTPANAGSVVTIGKKIYFNSAEGGFSRSLTGAIVDAGGEPFGCSLPILSNGLAYEGVLIFAVRLTSGKTCLVISTKTSAGGNLVSSTVLGSAIDIFDL